ncbi:TIGR00645 family protein [Caulobacter sp. 17J65-9]|uniref:TIGR00645 family protein n=1 Tax=Caulobacter sp. 17J65-9 TaxID=2709382 RepID=UPI0013CB8234|nr:TIGR00645 family protein [Caulobacter sp. 17J65-9]NEX94966.1 TIGR00645 family protein [Caulobacter sp. 17J65-9]
MSDTVVESAVRRAGRAKAGQGLKRAERALESALFASRWLTAPFYFGLILAVVMLLAVFVRELIELTPVAFELDANAAILAALSLIDLALAANLILIVVLAGYENFVSKIDTSDHEDRPAWMGTVGFSDIKLKLFASIVAISGIQLLKSFMAIGGPHPPTPDNLRWLVTVHLAFVATTVLSAGTDWLSSRAKGSRA